MTPAARLYNWNLIAKTLESCGVRVEEDVRHLIVGGDLQVLSDLLKQIMQFERSLLSLHADKHRPNRDNGVVDLDELDESKKPADIRNCLEFLLVTMSRGFKLRPKQVLVAQT